MGIDPIDASNASVPPTHPLTHQSLPLPTTVRGEPLLLTGNGGRHNETNADRAPLLLYARDKLLIVREIHLPPAASSSSHENKSTHRPSSVYKSPHGTPSTSGFVYRSHSSPVTAASFSPSGTYVASADARGKLRVWSYDHPDHLSKLDVVGLSSVIRDVAWDSDGKRIIYAGDGGTMQGDGVSAKAIQWDTAVRCGTLTNHGRKRAASCDVRPVRPLRVVTGGGEDAAIYLHGGPPFERRIGEEVAERCHERGSVNRLRYNKDGSVLVSAGTDGAVIFYEGKEMRLLTMKKKVHEGSVFGCVWNRTGEYVLTCGADGFVKLLDGRVGNDLGSVVYEWNLVEILSAGRRTGDRVPVGAMQLGCAFVKGDVPVSVGYNGQIAVLPLPSSLNLSFASAAAGLKEPIIITGHQAPISAMTFGAPGTNTIYTADTDGVIIEWDGSTGVARGRVSSVNDDDVDLTGKVHSGAITSLTFEGDTLYSCGWDDCIRHTRERLCTNHPLKIESQPNAMTRGGSLVVVMTVDGLLFLRDRLPVSELIRLPFTATAVCLSRDDSVLYVGGDDCNIYVYSVSLSGGNTGNPTTESHVIRGGHLKPVQSLMLSHNGTMLAAADVRDVCVYSAEDYSTVVSKGRWCFHTQRIGCLAWSPDDTVLASGGNDDDIFLWCVTKKTKRIHYRFAHRGGVTGLRFVGDAVVGGEGDWMLVSAGHDGCLNWWNVEEDVKSKFK